jgi:UDP-N-acetylmuramate--alanine ligase
MIGIGGIGMSGLASFFKDQGVMVSGYDRVSSPITDKLGEEGIKVHFTPDTKAIPEDIDLVIYTPALPNEHEELKFFAGKTIPVMKRAEVLKYITEGQFTVAVAGTHGKTSISSMIAHLVQQAGKDVNAFIGGIMKNYGSNYLGFSKNGIYITEADEYDRSFLNLNPDIALVSSMDADHLDVYKNKKEMINAFRQFASQIKPGGVLMINKKLSGNFSIFEDIFTYSIDGPADNYISRISIDSGKSIMDLVLQGDLIQDIHFNIPGQHNLENAVAAAAIGRELGLTPFEIKDGMESYQGVHRRFDIRINRTDIVYIDDYAHHPEEIKACIQAVREFYPGRKVSGIFQPHLYSRTKDLAKEFAASLDQLDEVLLLEIYPAREEPVEDVSSELILKRIKNPNKRLIDKSDLTDIIGKMDLEVLVTMGAGDIDQLVDKIEQKLKDLKK